MLKKIKYPLFWQKCFAVLEKCATFAPSFDAPTRAKKSTGEMSAENVKNKKQYKKIDRDVKDL